MGTTELIREAKISTLLPQAGDRLEASDVTLADGRLVVVFDNMPDIARIHPGLRPGDPATDLVPHPGAASAPFGYEGITTDGERFFALVEAAPYPDGTYRAWVHELDADLRPVHWSPVEVPIERPNKGLEGLCCVPRDGRVHLLALHEPPRGTRQVEVLIEGEGTWHPVAGMALPPEAAFRDYSALAVHGDRIAVVSQQDAAMWVGTLDVDRWQVRGPGVVHRFPRTRRIHYDAVEGVTWLDEDTLALVSDRTKRRRSKRRRRAEESVHVVRLSAAARRAHAARP